MTTRHNLAYLTWPIPVSIDRNNPRGTLLAWHDGRCAYCGTTRMSVRKPTVTTLRRHKVSAAGPLEHPDHTTLVGRIPTILEVIAQRITGIEKIPHPTREYEMYAFTAAVSRTGDIEITVSEFGPHSEAVRLVLTASDMHAIEPL